jgi:hypothetical protein
VVVAAIAVGEALGAGVAAEADEGADLVFGCEGEGLEGGAEVGAVAKGLSFGESAPAVEVLLACLQFHPGYSHTYVVGHRLATKGFTIAAFSSNDSGPFFPSI